ncbi:hypothetical protein HYH03_014141 [Edaphochlamys debaryana]|uniref:RNA-editing substrate-binding complex 6 protein domain-containing protein n=1 Tax=Edaphochlamys debaryana TaxID=47281 RepID=A0A836BSB2_9CHLO|nr:hypothetical protein HYH03_014141 [Edaphochlamys debaryana]|eukprot:KAG2487301.1 hypothetical protein HYH03_014141 [Edaphochlamys debaryana]
MYRGRRRGILLDDAQLQTELRPAVDAITRRIYQLIGTFDSWGASQSLWAYAELGWGHDELALRTLCEAALEVAPIFKPADCANAMMAFAKLDYVHEELLRQLVTTVLDTLNEFSPGEVAQVLWGFGRMRCHPGAPFLGEVMAAVQGRLQAYSTQELGMVLWGLARLGARPPPRFLRDTETVLLQRLGHLSPADMCMGVWSLSRLRYKPVRLLDEMPAALGPVLRSCQTRELLGIVSAFATAHHYHKVLLDDVAEVLVERMEDMTHHEVAVVLWTYGVFHHRPAHPDFGRVLAAELYGRMGGFSAQGLAMVAKALAQLQWRSEPLLVELAAAAATKIQAFKPLEMSQLLWGLTALQCRDLTVCHAVVRRCIAILKDPQHPHYPAMLNHRVVNSVIGSCQQLGYVPWTLLDFAESKGIRVKQPEILSSRDEEDEALAPVTVAAPSAAGDASEGSAAAAAAVSMSLASLAAAVAADAAAPLTAAQEAAAAEPQAERRRNLFGRQEGSTGRHGRNHNHRHDHGHRQRHSHQHQHPHPPRQAPSMLQMETNGEPVAAHQPPAAILDQDQTGHDFSHVLEANGWPKGTNTDGTVWDEEGAAAAEALAEAGSEREVKLLRPRPRGNPASARRATGSHRPIAPPPPDAHVTVPGAAANGNGYNGASANGHGHGPAVNGISAVLTTTNGLDAVSAGIEPQGVEVPPGSPLGLALNGSGLNVTAPPSSSPLSAAASQRAW